MNRAQRSCINHDPGMTLTYLWQGQLRSHIPDLRRQFTRPLVLWYFQPNAETFAKTKVLISFAVTAKLIFAFVIAYADCWFSHEAAHMLPINNLYFYFCQKVFILKLDCLKSLFSYYYLALNNYCFCNEITIKPNAIGMF